MHTMQDHAVLPGVIYRINLHTTPGRTQIQIIHMESVNGWVDHSTGQGEFLPVEPNSLVLNSTESCIYKIVQSACAYLLNMTSAFSVFPSFCSTEHRYLPWSMTVVWWMNSMFSSIRYLRAHITTGNEYRNRPTITTSRSPFSISTTEVRS